MTRWQRAWPALLLCAATVAAYGGVLGNGFVWDDEMLIVDNPDLRDLARLPAVLRERDVVGSYYRPISRGSYLLDFRAFGMDPRGFHAVNLALHLAAALLLYALGLRLFRRRGPALTAALLFAVHPLCSEAVAFVAARNNLLALAFSLGALLLFDRALGRRSLGWGAGAAALLLLGLLSKEPALMAAPLMLAWPHSESPPRRAVLLLPSLAAVALWAGLRLAVLGAALPLPNEGIGARLHAGLSFVPAYLGLALFPRALTIFHSPPALPPLALAAAWAAIAAGVALVLRMRSAAATFGLAWLAFELLPVSGVVAIPSAPFAERYAYLPLAGLALIAAAALWQLPAKGAAALAAAAVAALGARTVVRVRDWHDDLALARSAVAVDPRAVRAHGNLAVALKDAGDLDGAEREWRAALQLDPRDADSLAQLGTLAAFRGDYAAAEARWREALRYDDIRQVHQNLARLYELTGRLQEARAEYQAALRPGAR